MLTTFVHFMKDNPKIHLVRENDSLKRFKHDVFYFFLHALYHTNGSPRATEIVEFPCEQIIMSKIYDGSQAASQASKAVRQLYMFSTSQYNVKYN